MECDKLFPTNKWIACEKLEQLDAIKSMNCVVKVTAKGKDCCVCSLHIRMYELYRWTEKATNGNLGLQHLIEIFYAVLCHLMLFDGDAGTSDVESDDEIEYGSIARYLRHVRFIRINWYDLMDKTSLPQPLVAIIETATFKNTNVETERKIYTEYLEHYLTARNLDLNIDYYRRMHTAHYSQLFDEYFDGRVSGLVNRFGGCGPNPYTKHSFVTVHLKNDAKNCVGFVCLQEYSQTNRMSMQGIVSCPFYRKCQANQPGELGAANSLIFFLERYRTGRNIVVDPISQNPKWNNRLADIPFFVSSRGRRLEKREDEHKKPKLHHFDST